MNRIEFLDSIRGIQYPNMIVDFFDHFIALKQIVESKGQVSVDTATESEIVITITFDDVSSRDIALSNIQSGQIVIYNRPISVDIETISDSTIQIKLR